MRLPRRGRVARRVRTRGPSSDQSTGPGTTRARDAARPPAAPAQWRGLIGEYDTPSGCASCSRRAVSCGSRTRTTTRFGWPNAAQRISRSLPAGVAKAIARATRVDDSSSWIAATAPARSSPAASVSRGARSAGARHEPASVTPVRSVEQLRGEALAAYRRASQGISKGPISSS